VGVLETWFVCWLPACVFSFPGWTVVVHVSDILVSWASPQVDGTSSLETLEVGCRGWIHEQCVERQVWYTRFIMHWARDMDIKGGSVLAQHSYHADDALWYDFCSMVGADCAVC
jgi:hypothetical protein